MRVKDAFDVLVQEDPPIGVTLKRPKSTELNVLFPLPKDNKGDLNIISTPIIGGILCLFGVLFLYENGQVLPAVMLLFFGIPFLITKGREAIEETRFTHIVLELTPKGGQVYKYGEQDNKKLQAYYNWGELVAVSVEQVPKSKERPAPYYIYLETKNNAVRLFNGQISPDEISYAASMIEALLAQRYRGNVPANWRKSLEALEEPLLIDWSEHLIDD